MAKDDTRRHHWVVRLTHWVNVVALTIMVGSGLRIFNAYPAFARRGETFCCYPFEGTPIPEWLTFGGWLAGARNWHFAMMWVLVLNGLLYLGFIWLHGEWRDLVPRRGDGRDALRMIRFYLYRLRRHPDQGKHNALQKLAYFSMPLAAAVAVLSGVAIWKPVQLAPLTGLFGGYVWARYWHFVSMVALVVLSVGHIFMVFAVDPYSMRAILTGRYDQRRSPEARNARPLGFLFDRARPAPDHAPAGDDRDGGRNRPARDEGPPRDDPRDEAPRADHREEASRGDPASDDPHDEASRDGSHDEASREDPHDVGGRR